MSNTKRARRDANKKIAQLNHEVKISTAAQREGALLILTYLRKLAIYQAIGVTDIDGLIDRVKRQNDTTVALLT